MSLSLSLSVTDKWTLGGPEHWGQSFLCILAARPSQDFQIIWQIIQMISWELENFHVLPPAEKGEEGLGGGGGGLMVTGTDTPPHYNYQRLEAFKESESA